MRVPFIRYTPAAPRRNSGSGGIASLTKKFQNLPARRSAVAGCVARAVMKSIPSCIPALAARAGMVVPPSP